MRYALLTVLVAAALAGCGGDDAVTSSDSATPAPPPSAAPEVTATATATATPSATATTAPSPTTGPEDQPGGAGDEEAIRVPAAFTIGADGGITPQQIAVPAFFRIQFTVHNRSSQPVTVSFAGRKLMEVAAQASGRKTVAGRKKGSYVVSTNAGAQALVVTGVEPGP